MFWRTQVELGGGHDQGKMNHSISPTFFDMFWWRQVELSGGHDQGKITFF